MHKVTAVIQSSWKSAIMEYKALVQLANGKSVLETIVDSLKRIDNVDKIVLATSTNAHEDPIVGEAERLGLEVFRGAEDELLTRMAAFARTYPGLILKVDGNKPLFDPVEAEKLITQHVLDGSDYSYNGHYDGVIYGTDCEVFNSTVFEAVDFGRLTREQDESGSIHLRYLAADINVLQKSFHSPRHHYRLLLDNKTDLEVIQFVVKNAQLIQNDAIIPLLDANPALAKVNHIEPKREVGLSKIMLFPDKIKEIQRVSSERADPTYPISVELSLTMRCNFDCVWCSDKDLRAKQEDDLSLETISKLAKDLAANGTSGVVIEGGGEPTMVRHFDQTVDVFKEAGLSLGLITNGSKKLKPEILEKFDWIRVSLDASNAREMLLYKRYKGYDRVISNIIYYAQHCPTVGVGYVATNQNVSNMETLVLWLRDTGVSYIQIRPVIDHPDLTPDYDFSYLTKYQTDNFSVITDGMKENIIRGNNDLPCRSHSLSTVITADGSVYLCGRLNIYDWVEPIGNINSTSFNDIWHGEERRKQSSEVFDKGFCSKFCPECRITKFNIEFDKLSQLKTSNFI